jgi:TldD protein
MNENKNRWMAPARLALEEARAAGADYADVRVLQHRMQTIWARNERIHDLRDEESLGLAVRCLRDGSWGFAGASRTDPDTARSTARRAAEMARSSAASAGRRVFLAPEPPHVATHITPRRQDPFLVPLETKSAILLAVNEAMRKVPEIRLAVAALMHLHQANLFLSSEGAEIYRDRLVTSGSITAFAVGNDDRQTRTYEIPGKHAGWEHIEEGDLLAHAPRVAEEARMKLFAATGPTGPTDLVLDPEHLHLTIHESIGHATELDRVLGYEADYAGTSFATTEKLGRFQYGSKLVNVVADNTTPEFLASLGFDDEGVEGQRWDVIRDGVLVGYSTGREVAPQIGEDRSRGSCRAFGWWNAPIVRIPNLGIMPGEGTPEALIADTEEGIYIQGRGTFSIDQQRVCFQFGGDMFWRIKDGRLAGPLKNVVYRSTTPAFWNACDAICGPEDWRPIGLINCGKGQPSQPGQMTHYAATSRFRGIEVGRGQE